MDGFTPFGVQVYQPTIERTATYYKDENTPPEQATHRVVSSLDEEDPFADKYQGSKAIPKMGALRDPAKPLGGRAQAAQGFTIWEEPATQPAELPYRSYYGDNVPVLAEVINSQSYIYQMKHSWTRHAATLERLALQEGNHRFADMMNELVRQERVSLEEHVTGYYDWTPLQNIKNVWQWVGENGFYLRWSNYQRAKFRGMLKLLSSELRRGRDTSAEESVVRRDILANMCQCTLKSLRIDNIEVVAIGHAQYRFYPVGYSKPQHRRSDFSTQDQWGIDIFYPDYWVEEDRPGRDEVPENHNYSAATGEEHGSWEGRDEGNYPVPEESDEENSEARQTVESVLENILGDD